MTQYLNLQTQQLTTESQIRAENPNTSYPQPFPVPDGYALVFDAPQPTYDQYSQIVQQVTPVLTDKGHYEQNWLVLDLAGEAYTQAQSRKIQDEALLASTQYNAKVVDLDLKLKAFAAEKEIDIQEIPLLLASTNEEWKAQAQRVLDLYLASWEAFYAGNPLPDLTWE
jgi:hypothetical protein